METRFCYKISAEANMAYDLETLEPAECFTEVKLNVSEEGLKQYDAMHKSLVEGIAKTISIPPSYVTPISVEEYDASEEE